MLFYAWVSGFFAAFLAMYIRSQYIAWRIQRARDAETRATRRWYALTLFRCGNIETPMVIGKAKTLVTYDRSIQAYPRRSNVVAMRRSGKPKSRSVNARIAA